MPRHRRATNLYWNSFIVFWATAYVGYPDLFRVYQESVFTGREFGDLAKDAGIEVQLSGVQSHNAIGIGERYHDPLRRIFLRICEDVPDLDHHVSLQIAVKAMNDTMGPEGLVPSMLVFGTLPRLSPHSTTLPNHVDRMHAMEVARLEMTNITAKIKLQRALRSKLPPATKYLVNTGDQVYVQNEKERDSKW